MSENVFGAKLRAASLIEQAGLPIDGLPGDDPFALDDIDDETAKLLVIPISQEIAADFQLIGYDDTIRRIEEIITQRGKQRNVHLYGHNGVGKTALIHGLVQRKNRGDLSTHMFKRMFYRLNNSRLLHMDDVGEINKQFDQAIAEFGRYDVLVIENFYTLMTYLKLKGATVVMVAFLEALSRRRLQSIITSSKRERTLIINEVPEVHEFFLPEEITEPDNDQLLNILRGVHRSYEDRYDITIPDSAICTIRDLTQKYRTGMEGWSQPGRALILLDRSIAQFSVRMNSRSPELASLESHLSTAEYELQSITTNDDGRPHDPRCVARFQELHGLIPPLREKVALMRAQWMETTAPIQALQSDKMVLDKKLHTLINKRRRLQDIRSDAGALMAKNTDASRVSDELSLTNRMIDRVRAGIREIDDNLGKINLSQIRDHVVTPDHVAATFSELSGIPANQLNANERERVLKMEAILGERVYGQDQALKRVADAVRRERAKLTEEEAAPKGSFLFLGPSGVGKTELSKALAAFLTQDEKNMIRIDMSEFMEKHSVSRLVGAPPGYTGYDEGGVLTNAVSARPKSVLNFDESEKAHEDVFQILLQVLSDGRLTDGRGETVNFRETYCCFTSNLGGHFFIDDALSFEQAEAAARKEVERFFRPEFLGRLDAIICFRRLGVPMLIRVAKRRVSAINRSIGAQQLRLEWPDSDIETFVRQVQDPRYGARPILNAMKSGLEATLASLILGLDGDGGGVFHAGYDAAQGLTVQFAPAL